jgi:hypothetical protein
MTGLRALAVVVMFLAGLTAAFAQPGSPLASIDRELASLCQHLPKASTADAAAIHARLAALWREREAVLGGLPAEQREVAMRETVAAEPCLTLARLAAEPRQRLVAPRIAPKVTAPAPRINDRVSMLGKNDEIDIGNAALHQQVRRGPASVGPPAAPEIALARPEAAARSADVGPLAPDTTPAIADNAAAAHY